MTGSGVQRPTVVTAPRPQVAAPQPWALPAISSELPGKGLAIHTVDLPDRDLVAVTVHLDAPVTTEAHELAGIGVLAMMALDEGSANHDGHTFAAALDRIGADWSPAVGFSGATVTLTLPLEHLEAGLSLLAEALFTATFPEREVARLVGQRRDRLAQQLATPTGHANYLLREVAVAQGHRAHLPAGGTDATLAALTRDLVATHHKEVVLTGPVDMVVAGDLGDSDVVEHVTRGFSDFCTPDRTGTVPDPLRVQAGPRIVLVDHPGAVQTELRVVRIGPDPHDQDHAATRLLAHVLGGPLTSRLDAELREKRGWTYGVRSALQTFRRGGLFVLASGSFDTPNTAEALGLIRALTQQLADSGPTADEVTGAAEYLAGVIPLSLDTPRALSQAVAGNIGDDLPPDHTTTFLARLREASHSAVCQAAADHLRLDDVLVVAAGDVAGIRSGIEGLGWGEVVVHEG